MCKVYGYCRISTSKQSIERQIRNIRAAFPEAVIIEEVFTGTKLDGREKYERLCASVKPGDTIVFDSVSRMSRNAAEGYEAYQTFYNAGVELVFLKERYIDTATYKKALTAGVPMTGTNVDLILKGVNEYLLTLAREQIVIAFEQAEKEVTDLRQRTREGIETARQNGKQIGREKGSKPVVKKEAPAKAIIRQHCKAFGGTLDDAECMKLAGIARNTYYKYKREIKEGN